MRTVIANDVVVIWVVLLVYAPAFAWAALRGAAPIVFAAGGALSLTLISAIAYISGELGYGTIPALRVLAVLLGLVLLSATSRGVSAFARGRRWGRAELVEWIAVPLGLSIALWMLLPQLVAIRREGLIFGLAAQGNNDLPYYVIDAENLASAGFVNSNHIANVNFGVILHTSSYIGAIAPMNFISAATGLSSFQVATATMGLAVSFMAIALWALGRAIWPSAARAVALSVVVASLLGLSVYNVGQYFLGGVFGAAAVIAATAGLISVVRQADLEGFICLAAGAGYGVYAYGHIGLPVLAVLPVAAIVVTLSLGARAVSAMVRAVALVVAAELVALALASVTLADALGLVRAQSTAAAGWTLAPISATSATYWPRGISRTEPIGYVIGTWLVVFAVVGAALVSSRRGANRASANLAGLIVAGAVVVVAACIEIYGSDHYQTWKMEMFLLPVAAVAALPALWSALSGTRRPGRTLVAGSATVVLLCPWLMWGPTVMSPGTHAAFVTQHATAQLAGRPELAKVAVLNVRLPYLWENANAAGLLPKTVIVFSGASYTAAQTSLTTCTLTTRDMLISGETDFIPLSGRYVLLNRPSSCLLKKP